MSDLEHLFKHDPLYVMGKEMESLDDEIERLRELVEASKNDRKAIDELVDENLRLRELLRECQPFLFDHFNLSAGVELFGKVQKEVGDE